MSSEDKINPEEIKQIAVNACNGDRTVKVIEHHFEPYSEQKVGFLGNHQILKITVKTEGKEENVTHKFFVKSVPHTSEMQTTYVTQRGLFDHEAEFFNKVMPHLLEAAAVGNLEHWAPKCFLANERFIVLEDLRDKGFVMPTVKQLDVSTLMCGMKTMAHLHASSLLAEKKLGKQFNKLYPKACSEQIFDEYIQYQGGAKVTQSLVKEIARKHGKSIDKIDEMVNSAFEHVRADDSKRKAICHGDSWSNNLMLNSGEPRRCIFVDFQLVRYVNPIFDVAGLIYLSSTRELRQKEEKQLIRVYWDELCKSLRSGNPNIEIPKLKELLQDYEKIRWIAMVNALIYFPVTLVPKDVFVKYKDDIDTLNKILMFRTSNEFVLELMEENEDYSKMITEVALEFIDAINI